SAEQWIPDGMVPRAGDTIRMPAYARTLRRLVAAGESGRTREARIDAARTEWGSGFVARAAEEFVSRPHRHSTGTDHAGVLSVDDMSTFSAAYETPVTFSFRGHTIAKTGAWGQGPVLLRALAILDGYDAADIDPSTGAGAHRVLEALKLALADRDAYYGDPDPASGHVAPLDVLLSPAYAQSRRAQIDDRASAEFRPGAVP